MAKKEEYPDTDTLNQDDLKIIEQIILQTQVKASDAHVISSILKKIEMMTGKK
jgi:hypothetical protein